MTLGQMREILAANGTRLTRSLGQNFLHDANQIRRIVRLAGLTPGDRVLEIGPGLGPLTEELLAAGAQVLAIEKDRRLAGIARDRLAGRGSLELLQADALEWLTREPPALDDWHVVANLPYSVASPILVHLAQLPSPPRSMTVTLQAEVVGRIRAEPGSSEYGILTLLLAESFVPGTSFKIPARCFFPAPNVVSACVRLERRGAPLAQPFRPAEYRQLVKRAFAQRRKRLQKVLRDHWPATLLDAAWRDLALDPNARAEALDAGTFARLANHLAGHPGDRAESD